MNEVDKNKRLLDYILKVTLTNISLVKSPSLLKTTIIQNMAYEDHYVKFKILSHALFHHLIPTMTT
jgi:hypothetical protein